MPDEAQFSHLTASVPGMTGSDGRSSGSAGLLRELQLLLGQVYDADPGQDVRDFVVTDADLLAHLTAGSQGRAVDEKLVLVEAPDGLEMALFLDAAVLTRLAAADPRTELSQDNLEDFWTALEGVSHFNYLAWNAGFDKAVTLLELEMQAEVDKYVASRALLAAQPATPLRRRLLERLFGQTTLLPDLSPEERERYRRASELAARYCRVLERSWHPARFEGDMLRELRTFYRASQSRKLARIRSLAGA